MCAEVSAEFAIFEYDEVTAAFLEGRPTNLSLRSMATRTRIISTA
jgi:hypothetical protein